MRALGLITYEIKGRERLLPRGQLIIANHPSLLDVCFIIALIEESDCIVKMRFSLAADRRPGARGQLYCQ